jgi:ketosteroid isomerase-like protein
MPNVHHSLKILSSLLVFAFLATACPTARPQANALNDQAALAKTSAAIRAAFARDDIPTIMSYHHPDVIKSLSYEKYLVGRDAVQADIAANLQHFHLEWKENKVESLLIQGDTAIELTTFTIQGTPKADGQPFLFQGRAMIVYTRYKSSPTGWASIREMIQPAPTEN